MHWLFGCLCEQLFADKKKRAEYNFSLFVALLLRKVEGSVK